MITQRCVVLVQQLRQGTHYGLGLQAGGLLLLHVMGATALARMVVAHVLGLQLRGATLQRYGLGLLSVRFAGATSVFGLALLNAPWALA